MMTKHVLPTIVATLAALGWIGPSIAQTKYPERLIRIVVANPPGGVDDTISRIVASKIAPELAQPVIVENRGGGSTTIGGAAVAAAAPDGYTLLCLNTAGIAQTALREKLSYSLASFTPIVGIGGFPLGLAVSMQSKITNFEELTTAARSANGINFGSGGVGTIAQLNSVRLLGAIQGKGVHVPYKNNPDALAALSGGFIQLMLASASEVTPLRADGKLRVVAVTSSDRLASLPDVPTTRELGFPQINASLWYAFVAPAGTHPEIIAKLASAMSRAIKDPEFLGRFKPLAFQEDGKTGAALAAYINGEAARWREVIVANGIKVTD